MCSGCWWLVFSFAGAHVKKCALGTPFNILQPRISSAFEPYLDDEILDVGLDEWMTPSRILGDNVCILYVVGTWLTGGPEYRLWGTDHRVALYNSFLLVYIPLYNLFPLIMGMTYDGEGDVTPMTTLQPHMPKVMVCHSCEYIMISMSWASKLLCGKEHWFQEWRWSLVAEVVFSKKLKFSTAAQRNKFCQWLEDFQ